MLRLSSTVVKPTSFLSSPSFRPLSQLASTRTLSLGSPRSLSTVSSRSASLSSSFSAVIGRSRSLPQSSSDLFQAPLSTTGFYKNENLSAQSFSSQRPAIIFQVMSLQAVGPKDLDDIINYSMQSSSLVFQEGSVPFQVDRPIYPMSRSIVGLTEADAKHHLPPDGRGLAIFTNKESDTTGILAIVELLPLNQPKDETFSDELVTENNSDNTEGQKIVQFLVRGIRRVLVPKKEATIDPSSPTLQLTESQVSYKRIVINGCSSLIARHPQFTNYDLKNTETDNNITNENNSPENNKVVDHSVLETQITLSKLTEDQIVDLFYLLYLYEESHPLNLKFLSTFDTYSRIIEVITNQTSSEVRNAFHRSLRRRILAQKRLFRSVFFTDLIEDLLQLTNSKPSPPPEQTSDPSQSSFPPFSPTLASVTTDERVARRRIARDNRKIKIEPNPSNNTKGPNWNEFMNTLNSIFTPQQSSSTSSPTEKEKEKERETALSRHKQQTLFLVQWPLFTNPLTTQFRTMNQLINNLHLSKDINSFIQSNSTNKRNPLGGNNPFNPNKNPFSVGGMGGLGGPGAKGGMGGIPGMPGMGEAMDKNRDAKNISEKAKKLKLPPNVKKVYDEEMAKLASMPPSSSEYHVSKTYLDWLTSLPWGINDPENLDISHAEKILDEDHYGLEDLKTSILEFISIGNLKGTMKGKVLCFVGPPGTGKTSIGKSIARALGRKFYRFSVGGLSDVSEIKGHRRTYVGALPGKIIHGLKVQQTSNPVILLDEIDKLSRGYHGDPSAALLEVLDPEQNSNFTDHYVDLPYDLSKVLFICTANSTDTISKPLLDRMEILRLSGYVSSEKVQIAQKYLVPKILDKFGLKEAGYDISISETALLSLANEYCREAGIRNLEKKLEAIFRKIALEVARSRDREKREASAASTESSSQETLEAATTNAQTLEQEPEKEENFEEQFRDAKSERERQKKEARAPPKKMELTKKDLVKYLGKPRFMNERYYEKTPIGVVTGLAWSELGGSTLYIETVVAPHTEKKINITGKLGEVMQESVSLAYTYAKSHLARTSPDNDFFLKNSVHMHFPEGAVPKDGPSAGIAIITSLLSLARGIPVKQELAMTGEVTLTGLVLAVGGIKEKLVAAQRSGIKTVLLPLQNKTDYYELDRQIVSGLDIHFVETYDQVETLVFDTQSKDNVIIQEQKQQQTQQQQENDNKNNEENNKEEKEGEDNETQYIPPTISSTVSFRSTTTTTIVQKQ